MKRALIAAIVVVAFALLIAWAPDDPNPYVAHAGVQAVQVERVQGKGVEWWARRAVQARKDANARGRTIRILRSSLRARVDYAPRRGVASARATGLAQALLCIHAFEGAWTSNTGNGFYGGLQMDSTFESRYGAEFVRAWGHASAWPAYVQLVVALRAYLSGRGFHPWPNTARACGLLP